MKSKYNGKDNEKLSNKKDVANPLNFTYNDKSNIWNYIQYLKHTSTLSTTEKTIFLSWLNVKKHFKDTLAKSCSEEVEKSDHYSEPINNSKNTSNPLDNTEKPNLTALDNCISTTKNKFVNLLKKTIYKQSDLSLNEWVSLKD